MYYFIYGILLLATTCKCKNKDVVLTATNPCYTDNDNMTLVAEYKGSTTVRAVIWTITGCLSSMIIRVSTCYPFSIPSGFPLGRMSYDCSSAPKYRLTLQTLESADFNKTWGVDFSLLTGSTASGRQQQTVTQCETVDERNTGFPWWTIGLISLAVCVVAIIYCVYQYKQRSKDCVKKCKYNKDDRLNEESIPRTNTLFLPKPEHPDKFDWRSIRKRANIFFRQKLFRRESDNNSLNEEHIPCTNQATIDIRQWNVTNLLNEERMPSANEMIKYIRQHRESDLWDEERMPFTDEANKDIGHEIRSNPLDEERMLFTNEANKDIGQEIGCNCEKRFECNKGDSVKEADEEKHNEENSNGDPLNEANKETGREIEINSGKEFDEENHNAKISNCDSLNEEHIPCTNRATIDIRQWNVTSMVKTNSENN